MRCAAAGVSVYSPHTALDSIHGGINDWLASGLIPPPQRGEVSILGEVFEGGLGGQGRLVTLPEPVSMGEIERRVKGHLGLKHRKFLIPSHLPKSTISLISSTAYRFALLLFVVQVAYPHGQTADSQSVRTISICAGSGGSMLLGTRADVYFTGEMSHHEVLAAVATGHNVILCKYTSQPIDVILCSFVGLNINSLSYTTLHILLSFLHRWPHKYRARLPPDIGRENQIVSGGGSV